MSGRRPGNAENRRSGFKFNAMTSDELRRRREETQVEIRKAKREDSLNKRRNIVETPSTTTPTVSMTGLQSEVPRAKELSHAEFGARLPNMVQALMSPDLATQYQTTIDFRKVLAKERNAPIQDVVDARIVPRFVDILAGRSISVPPSDTEQQKMLEDLLFEAAWVLTNIASGEPEHTMAVVEAGSVPVFISLLRHHNAEIREQSIWALGNIAGDGPKLRDYVLQENIMSPLLENLAFSLDNGAEPKSVVRNGAWAISNLCRGSPSPSWNQVVVALPVIFRLLQVNDNDTLVDTCWALAYMTADNGVIADIVDAGLVPYIVPKLAHPNLSVQVPALRACGNIVTGNESQTQAVIDAGALPLFLSLLNHTRVSILKETCWAVSNITAGTAEQIQAVLDANIMPRLIHHLSFADYKVKKEACWAVCNATSAHETHPRQVKYIVAQGCLKPLNDLLRDCQDSRVILVALDGISNILEVGQQEALLSPDNANPYSQFVEEVGGLATICDLQEHPETEIYLKSKDIIDKYFDGEEDEDGGLDSSATFNFDAKAEAPMGGFHFN